MKSLNEEYRTVMDGAGWHDKRARGRLAVEGADAPAFLHALVTNDVRTLVAGEGVYAAYLTPQGRMIADLRIHRDGDRLLVDVPPGLAASLSARLDLAIFAEDVRASDVTGAVAEIGVAGAQAAAIVGAALDLDAARLGALPVRHHVRSRAIDAFAARADDAEVPTFDVFTPGDFFEPVVARLVAAGARSIDAPLVEALRVDAGRPAFGEDMTADTIPLEAGILDRAISLTKGCYVGQEVIVRVLHRGGGRVVKRLVRIEWEPAAHDVTPGAVLVVGDRDTGHVTSVASSLHGPHLVSLGYVHREAAVAGQIVSVHEAASTTRMGVVVALAG